MSQFLSLSSLSALMIRADLSVGAAGTTSWERACLGLPSFIIPVAPNQLNNCDTLHDLGAAIKINPDNRNLLVSSLRSEIFKLIHNPDILSQLSDRCLRLSDGFGIQRLVTCLLGPSLPLRLRSLLPSDKWLLYWWANDPVVRDQSLSSKPISIEDHSTWFTNSYESPYVAIFLLIDQFSLPLGQVRFQRLSALQSRVRISFSLDRMARGRGLSEQLIRMGLELVLTIGILNCRYLPRLSLLICFVFQKPFHGISALPGVREFEKTLNSSHYMTDHIALITLYWSSHPPFIIAEIGKP